MMFYNSQLKIRCDKCGQQVLSVWIMDSAKLKWLCDDCYKKQKEALKFPTFKDFEREPYNHSKRAKMA